MPRPRERTPGLQGQHQKEASPSLHADRESSVMRRGHGLKETSESPITDIKELVNISHTREYSKNNNATKKPKNLRKLRV